MENLLRLWKHSLELPKLLGIKNTPVKRYKKTLPHAWWCRRAWSSDPMAWVNVCARMNARAQMNARVRNPRRLVPGMRTHQPA